VVVSAKFGGEFKIMQTMQKSTETSIDSFAQQSTLNCMKMFSRSFSASLNLLVLQNNNKKTSSKNSKAKLTDKKDRQQAKRKKSEYSSTYLSIKGGSQEVAAIVANLNQPDFSDTFGEWLKTVRDYPKAFDFKYESIVSVLDINVQTLFSYTGERERRVCTEYAKKSNCKFGFTIAEFEQSWRKKLNALKFAITVYLKEPSGLTATKFFIEKGSSECRFTILNYISPFWSELVKGEQEFHLTLNFDSNEPIEANHGLKGEFYFKNSDEIYFMKKEEFWLAKRKGDSYSHQSAKLLSEPFKTAAVNKNLINLFGLVLEYNEKDATVTVANYADALVQFSRSIDCNFELANLTQNPYILYKPRYSGGYFKRDRSSDWEDSVRLVYKRDVMFGRKCRHTHKNLVLSTKLIKNLDPFWVKLWNRVIGVVDYVDPIQAVLRTWHLKFAVLPCQLKWSNNLIMILPRDDKQDGKCLRFTAATEGELFVVIATTPSDQSTWYTFQITTKGVIFYRVGKQLWNKSLV
jgi:hypothetical protein